MATSNYEPTAEEERFLKYHKKLRDELNRANWHFAILKHLRNLKADYLEELNQAPVFFGLTMRAHFLETVMHLNRFFDKRRDTLNIYKFLNFAEQNRGIFSNRAFEKRMRGGTAYDRVVRNHIEITPKIVEQDRQRLEKLLIRNLRKWRDKALAHIDEQFVLQDIDISKEYPVMVGDIEEVIDTLHEILNSYCCAYNASGWIKDVHLEHGIQWVLDSIQFRIREERKQWGLE